MTDRGSTRRGPGQRKASAPLVATVAIMPQRALPITDLLVVQFFVAASIAGALLIHRPGWYGAATGLAVALVFVIPIRGLSMPRWASERLAFLFERHRRKRRPQKFEPFDTKASDGSQIGFHWDGKILVSLLRIQQNPQAITVMEPAMTVSGETISVDLLADCLRQFDVTLDSIDVISQGARSHGDGHIGAFTTRCWVRCPRSLNVRCGWRFAWIRLDAPMRCVTVVGAGRGFCGQR